MASVTTPDLFTGEQPVNISNLDKIVGTDPSVFTVTKTNDYLDGGPTPPYRYFGTGDIAKLQSAVLLSDTSGSWNNPDVVAGGTYPDPNYGALYAQYESCICANGGTLGGYPAWWFFAPKFLDGGPVATAFGNSACFKDEDSLKFFLTAPVADGGGGLNKDKQLPSTYLFTESQNLIPAINEIVGATGLAQDGYADFKYYKLKTDQLTTTFEDHLGPIFTSADYARIKYKIGLAPTLTDAYFEGNLYSGLEVNYDAHTNFVEGFHNISGNIVYTTGDQLITGPKAFQKYTTFNTGVAISGDALISGGLTVNNPSTFNSEVAVSGDTIISGGLTVNKHAVFNSGVTVNSGDLTLNSGNLNMSGNLGVTGNSYLSGELWILGADGKPCRVACSGEVDSFNKSTTFNSGVSISGDLNVTGNSYLSGQLWILGPDGKPCQVACSGASSTFNQHTTFNSGVTVNSGDLTINSGNLNMSGDLNLTGNAYISGQLWILGPDGKPCKVACSGDGGTTVVGNTTNFNSTNVNISGDTLISGGLTVNKHATFNSGVTVNSGDLTINSGNLNMSGDLNLTGNAYISGQLWILGPDGKPCKVACSGDGGTTIVGNTTNFNSTNVNISGDTLISGGLTVNKHATFNSGVTVNSGDLTINSGNLNMSGDLNLTGNAYISGQLWILGPDGKPCKVACSGASSTFNQHTTFNSGVTVNSGDLTINSGNLNMSGDLNLTGNAYISGQLWILGSDGKPCRVACSGEGSPLTTKGDIWGYDTDNARLPVGSDTQVLVADANRAPGVKWTSPCLALTGCHQFGIGDPISDALIGLQKSRIAQYDHAGALTESDGTSLGCYGFASTDGLISGASAAYQFANLLIGGVRNSITGYIGQSNMLAGGILNTLVNAESATQLICPFYSTIAGGIENSITGFGLHAGLLLGGRGNKILAKTTIGNTKRDGQGATSGPNYMAGFNQILGGSNNLITQTIPGTSWPADSSARGAYGNTIIGAIDARIENQSETVLIQAGQRAGYSYAHTGDGTSSARGRTMTLSAVNGIFASGNLYVTGAGNSWIRITGGAGGGGGLTSPLTTKGDLWGYDTDNARLPVGSDGQVLISDATAPLGVKWSDSGAGSIFNQHTVFNSGVTVNSGDLTINSGNLNMSGDLNVTGNAYISGQLWILGPDGKPCKVACSGASSTFNQHTTFNSGVTVNSGDLTINSGNLNMSGDLNLTGNAYISGQLWILGGDGKPCKVACSGDSSADTFNNYVTFNSGVSIATDSAISGVLSLHNVLNAYVHANFEAGVSIRNNLQISGELLLYRNGSWCRVACSGDDGTTVVGNTTNFNSTNVNISGDTLISGGLTVNKYATFNSGVSISGDLSVTGNSYLSGELWILGPDGKPCKVACSGASSTFNEHTTFNSGVTVNSGDLTINSGNLNMSGDLNLTGNAYISGQLWILGGDGKPCKVACSGDSSADTFNNYVTFNSGVSIATDSAISGVLSLYNVLNAYVHANFEAGVSIRNNLHVSGDLTVEGSTQLGLTNITGDLGVSGCIKSYQCVTDSSAASYTLSASDFGKIVHYNPASDAVFNLPTTASVPTIANGWQATVMNISSNNITLTPLGGLVLKSVGTIITGQYQAATVYYQGGDWYAAGALSS